MTKNKGIYDFLYVINKIQEEHNIKVAIAGYSSSEVMDHIKALIGNNSIKNIELYQDIDEDTKYKLYSRSRIYVLPSIEDGVPITFYEAWSYGDLVIAYDLKTYSDIKDYFIGVKKGDLRELTAKCMEVYENYSTNLKSLSAKSYNYSLNHSYINGINNIIENIEKINKINEQVQ
jgi:glycosyltransferase involved in cell wall biosynthesis